MARNSIEEIREKLDALRGQPDEGTAGREMVKLLVELSSAFCRSDPEKAEGHARQALALAERIGFKKGCAESHRDIGLSYWARGNYDKALGCFAESLRISEEIGDEKGVASCYSNIGIIHGNRGDHEQALACHLKALRVKEEIGDKRGTARAYNNIGIIYDERSNYSHALEYYRNALRLFEELGDKQGIAISYNNIGIISETKGDFDSALEHYHKSLEIKEEIGDRRGIADAYMNIGTLCEKQEEYDIALEYCLKALDIFEDMDDKRGITESYHQIGRIHTRLERYDSALTYLKNGLSLAEEIGTKELETNSYEYLSELHQAQGDFEQALAYHRKYSELREKIFNDASAESIAQMQVRYETEKREKEAEIYRGIFENTVIGMYRIAPEGDILMANSALVNMLGYSSFDELAQHNLLENERYQSLHPRSDFRERIARHGAVLGLESVGSRQDGSSLCVRESFRAVKDEAGEILYYEGTVEDITERKRVEEALRESEEKYRTIFERSPEAIVLLDARAKITDVNGRLLEWLGYEPREVIGKSILKVPFLPKESKTKLIAAMRMRKRGEMIPPLETEFTSRTGTVRTGEGFIAPIRDEQGGIVGDILVIADITERKQAEVALKESEEKFRILVQHQGEGITAVDENEYFTFANPAAERILGVAPGSLIGRNLSDFVDEETFQFFRDQTESRKQGESNTYDVEINRPDGDKRQLVITATPRLSGDGTFIGTYGIFRDMTEQKRIEEALKQSEEKLRSTIASMDDLLFVIDEGGIFIEYYQPLRKHNLYLPSEHFLGKSFKEVLPPDIAELTEAAMSAVRATGASQRFDYPLRIADKEMWFGTTVSMRRDNLGDFAGVTAVCRDITDRKLAEDALHASRQKVEDLHGTTHRLMGCEAEDDVYKLTIDGANDIIDFSLCILYIARDTRLVPEATNPPSYIETHGEHGFIEKLAQKTWRTHKTYIFGTPAEIPVKGTPPNETRSGISAPIADLGVLQVFSSEPQAFNTDDARLLELLLGHVAGRLERIRLEKALRDQAIHDSLTGVFNRHHLDQALRRETKRCMRSGCPLDLLMIDIDRFKEINDRFGHRIGDKILQRVAALLLEEIRESDVIVRYGGDEFLILLPENKAEPDTLISRLSKRVARRIARNRLVDFPVTLSIGWARWNPRGSESVETTLVEADRRMYESKRSRPEIK